MALRAVLFGTEKISKKFKLFYDAAVKRGDFEIVEQIVFDSKTNRFVYKAGKKFTFDIAIISPNQDLYVQTNCSKLKASRAKKLSTDEFLPFPIWTSRAF